MIFDNELYLSRDQAITVSAPSENHYDRGHVPDYIQQNGLGGSCNLYLRITEKFRGGSTLRFCLQHDDYDDFSSLENVCFTRPVGINVLVKDQEIAFFSTPEGLKRFFRLYYIVENGPMTTGKVTAAILLDSDTLSKRQNLIYLAAETGAFIITPDGKFMQIPDLLY